MAKEQLVAKKEQLRGMRPTPFSFYHYSVCVFVCVNFKFLGEKGCMNFGGVGFKYVDCATEVVILCYPILKLFRSCGSHLYNLAHSQSFLFFLK